MASRVKQIDFFFFYTRKYSVLYFLLQYPKAGADKDTDSYEYACKEANVF